MPYSEYTLTLAAAADNNIATAQDPASGADLTLDGALASGGVATLDVSRRVLISSTSDDRLVTFTVYGTNRNGIAISEAIAGSNASTTYTLYDFKTVTRIATSGNAGSVKVGTTTVKSGPWIPCNRYGYPADIGFRVKFTTGASLTAKVEVTFDDVENLTNVQTGGNIVPTDSAYTALTSTTLGNFVAPVMASRLTITAFTSGSVSYQLIQAGPGR